MNLEEEIKQKQFRNIYHKTVVNIIYTHNWVSYRLNNILKQFDLTPQQFNILRILRGQHPQTASIKLIKERMLDKKSDVSRVVDNLLKKGLVTRKNCPKDRRHVHVAISNEGLTILQNIDATDREMDDMVSNITIEEAKELNRILDKIRKDKF